MLKYLKGQGNRWNPCLIKMKKTSEKIKPNWLGRYKTLKELLKRYPKPNLYRTEMITPVINTH